MADEPLPPRGRNQTTEEFERRSRNGMSGALPPIARANPTDPPFQTSIGTDIGNFFRVLLAFLSGLWNRDFAEFDLLSSVYFPPGQEDENLTPAQRAEREGVQRMIDIRNDPNHPDRQLSTAALINRVSTGVARPANFDDIIKIFLPFEGGLNRNEPFGAIANFGINSRAHPHLNVENLTREQAIEIYRTEYWNKIQWPGGDPNKMSGAVKLIAFDAAANAGLGTANRILREAYSESGGDVSKMHTIMLAKRRAHYASLIANNPGEYAKYKDGWESRMRTIEGLIVREDMTQPVNQMYARQPAGQLYVIAPVDTSKFRVSGDHGVRHNHPVHGGPALHRGTDYSVPRNTMLFATNGGTVVSVRSHNGYGNTVVIAHGNGVYEMYAHLDRSAVKVGDVLNRGQLIAYSGNTGTSSTGAHLHHEWWVERGGNFYTVNEQKAQGKNIKDPNVQEQLVRDSQARAGGFSPEATITANIPAQFKGEMSALTARDRGIDTGTMALAANNTSPGMTTTR